MAKDGVMKRSRLRYIFFFSICHCAWAMSPHATSEWYFSAGAGVSFPDTDQTNYISSGPGWPNDEYRYQSVHTQGLIALGAGYMWPTCKKWLPYYSIGLNYQYGFPAHVVGKINQFSLAQFANYDFRYRIQRQTLFANLKGDIVNWYEFMPFVAIGAGVSFNKIDDYNESPMPGIDARISPGFTSNTTTNFSYLLGAGIDYFIPQSTYIISLEYQYGYFGHVKTGVGISSFVDDRLSSTLTANTLIVSLRGK